MASEPQTTKQGAECVTCKALFEFEIIEVMGVKFGTRTTCPACNAKVTAEAEAKRAAHETAAHEAAWLKVCPPLYDRTDPSNPSLSPDAVKTALQWAYAARGLGFVGPTGRGKTRCLFLAMRNAFDDGHSCAFVSHNSFSRTAIDAFSADDREAKADAMAAMKRFKSVKLLLLDDLGKAPASPRADAELEELIEHRAGMNLPLFWTANASGAWLIKRFGEDRGEPLVRRLAEFTEIVSIQ